MKRAFIYILAYQFFVIALALLVAAYQDCDMDKYFLEKGFVTWFSFVNLMLTSYIASIVFYNVFMSASKTGAPGNTLKTKLTASLIWLGITAGFLFLSLDEILMIHEKTDRMIHKLLHIKRTELTGRLNDLILFLCAVFGAIAIYFNRRNLLPFHRAKYLLAAAILSFLIMMTFDYFGKDNDDYAQRHALNVLEESFKLIGEGFFILTALNCLKISEDLRVKKNEEKYLNAG